MRAAEHRCDLTDGAIAADGNHDVAAALDRALGVTTKLGPAIDDGTLDLPTRLLEERCDLADHPADVAALPPAPEDQRGRHPLEACARRRRSQFPPPNAAATMSNHAAPARSPPTTSVR